MGGANDISRNETKNCINTLKSTHSALTSKNVVVLNIPTRHDLIKESIKQIWTRYVKVSKM
jgi:radical SAM superfamily enzyme